jgi:hypothetical protein
MHDTLGHLLISIMEIPWGTHLPIDDKNAWTMILHEDALTGEGGKYRMPNYGSMRGPRLATLRPTAPPRGVRVTSKERPPTVPPTPIS